MLKTTVVILGIALVGCASTHPGMMGTSKLNVLPLKVSAETIGDSSGAFQMLEITLENTSDDWVRVTEAEVLIPPSENKLSVVVGQDLKDWASAMEAKASVARHNQDMTTLGVIAAGFLAGFSNDPIVSTIGGAAVVGGAGASVANDLSRAKKNVTKVQLVPETHLMHPFSVPGTLPMKRWVLINKSSKVYLHRLAFSVTTIDGKKDIYEVELAP